VKKKTLTAALILLTFFLIMAGFNIARAQDNSGIIKSPLNHFNYATNLLTLKITLTTVFSPESKNFGSDEYYYITYSIDGEENIRIPKESITYEISHGTLIPNNLTATVALPTLNDGYHTLTVNAREPYILPGQTGYYFHHDTVDFTVNAQPTPSPTSTPHPNPTPSTSPSPTPSTSPTLQPTLEPSVTSNPIIDNNSTLVILVIAIPILILTIGLAVYFRKRRN
jgi:hypothetical protein